MSAPIEQALSEVPKCVAAGIVDLETGMLLAVRTANQHPNEILDMVAAATADLFQGDNVVTIEKLFRKSRGQAEDGKHYVRGFHMFSDTLLHLFWRGDGRNENKVAVFVCRADTNLGMAHSKSKAIAEKMLAAL